MTFNSSRGPPVYVPDQVSSAIKDVCNPIDTTSTGTPWSVPGWIASTIVRCSILYDAISAWFLSTTSDHFRRLA